jgi:hypothetical protein
VFEDAGFSVHVCESGEQASALRTLSFDCAVIVTASANEAASDDNSASANRPGSPDHSDCVMLGAELVRIGRAATFVNVPAPDLRPHHDLVPDSGVRMSGIFPAQAARALGARAHDDRANELIEIPQSYADELVARVSAALPPRPETSERYIAAE